MRQCIFCGRRGKLTKEHLWPDWLRESSAISEKINVRLEDEKDGDATRDQSFETVPFNFQVRAVCAECNGGWMSDIEAEAKPLIERAMHAEGALLNPADQRKLASWALLKACIVAEASPDKNLVPIEHRTYLFDNRKPPSEGVWVRLGTYEARDLMNYAYQGLLVPGKEDSGVSRPTIYFATITVGALLVHVAGSLLPEFSFGDVPGLEPLHVPEIWPTEGPVDFEQKHVLRHETYEWFSKVFYKIVGQLTGGAPPAR